MRVDLTGQAIERDAIAPKLQKLKTELLARKELWAMLPPEKRAKWIKSGRDPIIDISKEMYGWLRDNFFGERFVNGRDI